MPDILKSFPTIPPWFILAKKILIGFPPLVAAAGLIYIFIL
jgi:hypothetical protein